MIGSFSYDGIIINYKTVLQKSQKNRIHDLIRFNKKPQIGFPNFCCNFKSQAIHIISKSNDLPSCVMSLLISSTVSCATSSIAIIYLNKSSYVTCHTQMVFSPTYILHRCWAKYVESFSSSSNYKGANFGATNLFGWSSMIFKNLTLFC